MAAKPPSDSHETRRLPLGNVETLPAGTVLQSRYEILKVIGVGGMGAVYQARDRRFADVTKVCAVKEMISLTSDLRLRQLSLDNFGREANILATLSHPSIPKIFDFFSEGQRNYLVIEFIDGRDLEVIIENSPGFIEESQAVEWAIQICDVLSYLHGHRPNPIVFRDLKPSNIMVNSHNWAVLIDFGIAKVFQIGEKGTMIGTEGYSPPEQYRGVAEPRGDIYALGATLHHLLTKRDPRLEPPFTFHERPIRRISPLVSERVEAIVARALEYEPERRFSSALEMKAAFLNSSGPKKTAYSMGASVDLEFGAEVVKTVWEFKCEDEVRSSPRVHQGILYAGAYDNNLYALDAKTGALRWKYPTEGGICSSPVIWEGNVYIGSEDNTMYCLRTDNGRIVWSCPTRGRIRSSPRVALDHVFFGSDDGELYALNARSGREVWRYKAGGPIRSTACVEDDLVFFGCTDGYVYALEIQTGHSLWRFRTNREVISSPAVFDNLLIVGSGDWSVYAFDHKSGFNIWRRRTNHAVIASPTIAGGQIYIGSADKNMYCLDVHTGRIIWKYIAEEQITSSATIVSEAVYFGCVDNYLYKLDAKSGDLIWRFKTGGPIPSSPAVDEQMVYIGSTDHKIYALPL